MEDYYDNQPLINNVSPDNGSVTAANSQRNWCIGGVIIAVIIAIALHLENQRLKRKDQLQTLPK
jgi:hypothetical protein